MTARLSRHHTYAVAAWAVTTFLVVTLALGSFAHARPSPADVHPVLVVLMCTLFIIALITGVRARFVIGTDPANLRLRRVALALFAGVFVIATPPALHAIVVGGEAGLYDHWRAVLPTPLGLGLAVSGLASGSLFCLEVFDAVSEARKQPRGRARFLAILFVVIGVFFAMVGLSAFVIGRAFLLGGT